MYPAQYPVEDSPQPVASYPAQIQAPAMGAPQNIDALRQMLMSRFGGMFQHPQNTGVVPPTPMGQMDPKHPMGPGTQFMPYGKGPDVIPPGPPGGGPGAPNPWLEGQPVTGGRPETGGPYMQNPYDPSFNGGIVPPHRTPQGQMDPKYPMGTPRPQPQMTRGQWQQNRLGHAPAMPPSNPIYPQPETNGNARPSSQNNPFLY